MAIIDVEFDGRVFIPRSPVNVPAGSQLKIILVQPPRTDSESTLISANNGDDKFHDDTHPLMGLVRLLDSLPDVESDLPTDASKEVDHYLYGTPKRES